MIRVISSPSISTTGVSTLIFAIVIPFCPKISQSRQSITKPRSSKETDPDNAQKKLSLSEKRIIVKPIDDLSIIPPPRPLPRHPRNGGDPAREAVNTPDPRLKRG
jgi:hypothetical protein